MAHKMDQNKKEFERLESQKKDLLKMVADIPSEQQMKIDIRSFTHKYNEVKDATQTVIGALAHIKGVTYKSLHTELNVPSD